MIKIQPPSFMGAYDAISVFDGAMVEPEGLERLPSETSEAFEQRKLSLWEAWRARLNVARETAQWDGMLKPGIAPSRFHLRQVPGHMWTVWQRVSDGLGYDERCAVLVRMALIGASDWLPGFKVGPLEEHRGADGLPSGLGAIAPVAVIDAFYLAHEGALASKILEELAVIITQHRLRHSGN